MSIVVQPMTVEELLALPEDKDRWLIAGKLRERPRALHNRFHALCLAAVAAELEGWRVQHARPGSQVLAGEAGVTLQRNPDTSVGVDVAYVSAAVMARQTDALPIVEGIPTLVVEILSPRDVLGEVNEKIHAYLNAGVPLTWIIDTDLRTVTIHQPGHGPELVNDRQELSGEPHLPGFRVPVARLFD